MKVNKSNFNSFAVAMLSCYTNRTNPDFFNQEVKEYIESDEASSDHRKTYALLSDLLYSNVSDETASALFEKINIRTMSGNANPFTINIVALIVCHDTNRHDEEEKLLQWLNKINLSDDRKRIADLLNDYVSAKMSDESRALIREEILAYPCPPF